MHDERGATSAMLTLALMILGLVVMSAASWMQGAP